MAPAEGIATQRPLGRASAQRLGTGVAGSPHPQRLSSPFSPGGARPHGGTRNPVYLPRLHAMRSAGAGMIGGGVEDVPHLSISKSATFLLFKHIWKSVAVFRSLTRTGWFTVEVAVPSEYPVDVTSAGSLGALRTGRQGCLLGSLCCFGGPGLPAMGGLDPRRPCRARLPMRSLVLLLFLQRSPCSPGGWHGSGVECPRGHC